MDFGMGGNLSWANSLFGEKKQLRTLRIVLHLFQHRIRRQVNSAVASFEHFKVSLSDGWWFWVFVRDAGHSMHNWLYMIILVSDSVAYQDCEGCQVFDGFWRVWSGIESKVECLRSTTSFGLWCGWLFLSSRDKGYITYVCVLVRTMNVDWGETPKTCHLCHFFWWLWRNSIHLAASGSSRHLWSTIVHPLQGVTVNHWKIGRVSFGITQASLFAVNFEWWNPLEIPIPLEIYTHPPCLPVKSGLLRRVLIDNGCIPGRDVGRRA